MSCDPLGPAAPEESSDGLQLLISRRRAILADLATVDGAIIAWVKGDFAIASAGRLPASVSAAGAPFRAALKPMRGLCEIVARVLRSAGEPMTRYQITRAILDAGYRIGGKDPASTIGVTITRNRSRFLSVPGMRWWIVGEAVPEPSPVIHRDPVAACASGSPPSLQGDLHP